MRADSEHLPHRSWLHAITLVWRTIEKAGKRNRNRGLYPTRREREPKSSPEPVEEELLTHHHRE